jgi:uncharacterized protein YkwD
MPLLAALLIGLCLLAAPAHAASLDELRAAALEAVNADRDAHGLSALRPDPALDAAAQAHAEDMRERGYFGHVSPEGRTAMDRYRAAGGERWRKIGENVGRCARCGAPGADRVRSFQEGWMNSPEHRRNILDPGYRRFGFGMVGGGGEQYAVQTFSGPGGLDGEAALAQAELRARAAAFANRLRAEAGAPALAESARLSEAARVFLEERLPGGALQGAAGALLDRLGGDWGAVAVLVGQCGGCGLAATGADVERFMRDWSGEAGYRGRLLDPAFAAFGFALWTDGEGRKVALALLARRPQPP